MISVSSDISLSPSLIEADSDLVAQREALARKHIALPYFIVLERVVDRHFDLALEYFGAAGRTDSGLAGVRRLDVGRECGVEEARANLRHAEGPSGAVEGHRRLRGRVGCGSGFGHDALLGTAGLPGSE